MSRSYDPPAWVAVGIVAIGWIGFAKVVDHLLSVDYAVYQAALAEVGRTYEGANVGWSQPHSLLEELAQQHSDEMAKRELQDHSGFQQRFDKIHRNLGLVAAEICAESWDWQRNDTPEQLATDAFLSWSQSPGHWSVASKKHRYAGYGMAKGKNGIWYATILVCDP